MSSHTLNNPESSPERRAVLDRVAAEILRTPYERYLRVAVDGVDGAGKTLFADELASTLTANGAEVVRASVDGFHNPPALRNKQGRTSPRGFYEDSFDYDSLNNLLLEPFGARGNGQFVRAIYDVVDERPVDHIVEEAFPETILLVDGIFLHRPELRPSWGCSVFLEVQFDVSISRMAARDSSLPDPQAESNHRYIAGQRIYMDTCNPIQLASIVIDNNDLAHPWVLRSSR